MTRTCIVKPHRAGLFSQINKVITCLRMYETVCVDWSEGSLYGDCWDDLFTYNNLPFEDDDVITDYPFYDLTARMAGVLYESTGWGWRQRFHPLWEKLGCKIKPLDIKADIGVLVRVDGHRGEQLTDRSQGLSDYAAALNEAEGNRVFVMSSDHESLMWFVKRYGAEYNHEAKRSIKRSDPDLHLTIPQAKEDAIQVMREVLTLAQCQTIIHPISNMATAALIINPDSKSVYLK